MNLKSGALDLSSATTGDGLTTGCNRGHQAHARQSPHSSLLGIVVFITNLIQSFTSGVSNVLRVISLNVDVYPLAPLLTFFQLKVRRRRFVLGRGSNDHGSR
jgi:hypothetical protein